MDEGMPWRIIMIFFTLGALLGIRGEINLRAKIKEKEEKEELKKQQKW